MENCYCWGYFLKLVKPCWQSCLGPFEKMPWAVFPSEQPEGKFWKVTWHGVLPVPESHIFHITNHVNFLNAISMSKTSNKESTSHNYLLLLYKHRAFFGIKDSIFCSRIAAPQPGSYSWKELLSQASKRPRHLSIGFHD